MPIGKEFPFVAFEGVTHVFTYPEEGESDEKY
jgi:hypothetical protein